MFCYDARMLKKTEPVGDIIDIVENRATDKHRVLCVTSTISEIKTLDELVGAKVTHTPLMLNNACCVILHGEGRPARKALSASTALELPVLYTDFGALKTFRHGREEALSLCFDHLAPHQDGSQASHLEGLIKRELSPEQVARAERLIKQWKRARASRCNQHLGPKLPDNPFVAILAEPPGDPKNAIHSAQMTIKLAEEARKEFPSHQVVIVQTDDYAADALANATAVFTHSSPVGFEALVWGKPLYVSGMPFYAGWGLSKDLLPAPARRGGLSQGLAQLTHGYLVEYCRYASPIDHQKITPEQALELVANTRQEALDEAKRLQQQRAKLPKFLRWLAR